jgi:hypothetical protein
MVYPALLPLVRTPRLPVVDWTDAPADLNGLVRFAERRNMVSARVPSHFKRSLTSGKVEWPNFLSSCTVWVKSSQCKPWGHPVGGGSLATLIINLDTRQRWLARFTVPPFHPCDSLRYVLNTRLAWPQSLSGCSRDDRKITNEIDKLRCYFENAFLLTNRKCCLIYAIYSTHHHNQDIKR